MIEEGLATYLLAQSAITDIVSTRIRFGMVEQRGSRPYLCIRTNGYTSNIHASGETAIATTNLQVICVSSTMKLARELSDLVRLEVSGYSGAWGSENVRMCRVSNMSDRTLQPRDGSELQKPTFIVDLEVIHTITAATY